MGTYDEYLKSYRSVSINDFGQEITVRTQTGDTWSGLVELAVNAIRGLGYYGVPSGDAVIEAIEYLRAEEAAAAEAETLADLDPEVVDAAR